MGGRYHLYPDRRGLAVPCCNQRSMFQEGRWIRFLRVYRHTPDPCRLACMAIQREKTQLGLIFHSDRGTQYAAVAYQNALAVQGIRQSMSYRGNPYDNAVAENFFSCLKCELVSLHRYSSRAQAQNSIFAYIETFYNSLRPHSSLAWRSPNLFLADLPTSS